MPTRATPPQTTAAKKARPTPARAPAAAPPARKRPAKPASAGLVIEPKVPAAVPQPTKTAKPAKAPKPAKPVKPAKPPKATKPRKAAAPAKPPKLKRKPVRDSFTMPEADFALIATLKARALATGRETKKSELLRAGLHALASMQTTALVEALQGLEPVKVGRPKKD